MLRSRALLSYRAALAAAAAYCQALEAAFDLHRFDLLTALHLPLPANLIGEMTPTRNYPGFSGSRPNTCTPCPRPSMG
jgi:hypothetical protein